MLISSKVSKDIFSKTLSLSYIIHYNNDPIQIILLSTWIV